MTDIIGKPVLMLDASRRVTGAVEYDVFGLPNRVSLDKETAHPYSNNSNQALADFTQAIGGTANPSTQVRIRAIFDVIDTEGPVAAPADFVFLKDPDGGVALTSNIGGPHRGQVWSPWVVPSAGRVQVPFLSNATGNTYTGVVMAGYEYQRFQVGAQPFWTPLGFSGQYHDAETDVFQNWNRFYDPSVGRFLEPEPLVQYGKFAARAAARGREMPAYAFGLNNPLFWRDLNGLDVTNRSSGPVYVKPEDGAWGTLPSGQYYPGKIDGVIGPNGDTLAVYGRKYLPDNHIVVGPDGVPQCTGGLCALLPDKPWPNRPGSPDDPDWIPPPNPPVLPGCTPAPPPPPDPGIPL